MSFQLTKKSFQFNELLIGQDEYLKTKIDMMCEISANGDILKAVEKTVGPVV